MTERSLAPAERAPAQQEQLESSLARFWGTVDRAFAQEHLKVLRDAGLVRGRVDGQRRLYRVDSEGLERLRGELDAFWQPALAALKDAAEARDRP